MPYVESDYLRFSDLDGAVPVARRTVVELVDDIDGGPASETLLFGLDGDAFEIDVSQENAHRLRDALAPYIGAARRAGAAPPRRRATAAPRPRSSADVDPKAVRAWAAANGVEVNPRGRLKAEVIEQYRAAEN